MRNKAPGAVFHTLPGEPEIAPAAVSEKIQRTITEQAVEIVLVSIPVAGKIFAVFV